MNRIVFTVSGMSITVSGKRLGCGCLGGLGVLNALFLNIPMSCGDPTNLMVVFLIWLVVVLPCSTWIAKMALLTRIWLLAWMRLWIVGLLPTASLPVEFRLAILMVLAIASWMRRCDITGLDSCIL